MNQFFYIKQGDTAPALLYRVQPNLLGATVVFNLEGVLSRAPASFDNDTLRYDWQEDDTSLPGRYKAEFEVTYADGTVETFPNSTYLLVQIIEDLA